MKFKIKPCLISVSCHYHTNRQFVNPRIAADSMPKNKIMYISLKLHLIHIKTASRMVSCMYGNAIHNAGTHPEDPGREVQKS